MLIYCHTAQHCPSGLQHLPPPLPSAAPSTALPPPPALPPTLLPLTCRVPPFLPFAPPPPHLSPRTPLLTFSWQPGALRLSTSAALRYSSTLKDSNPVIKTIRTGRVDEDATGAPPALPLAVLAPDACASASLRASC